MGRGSIVAAWMLAAAGVVLAPAADAAPRTGARVKKTAEPAKKKVRRSAPTRGRTRSTSPERAAAPPATSSTTAPSGPPTPWSNGRIWTTTFSDDTATRSTTGAAPSNGSTGPTLSLPPISNADATSSDSTRIQDAIATSAPDGDRDRAVEPRSLPRRRVTLGLNPLPLIAGRYGLNVEVVPIRHHALVASAWLQTFTPAMLRVLMPSEVDVSKGAEARLGGELGYRFYTGSEGADGLFAGVSGVAMPIVYPRVSPELESEVSSFHAYGGAIDVGAQAITSGGFTIGGGLGVMYLAYTPPASAPPPPGVTGPSLPEPHVLPRLLLAAGWSF